MIDVSGGRSWKVGGGINRTYSPCFSRKWCVRKEDESSSQYYTVVITAFDGNGGVGMLGFPANGEYISEEGSTSGNIQYGNEMSGTGKYENLGRVGGWPVS